MKRLGLLGAIGCVALVSGLAWGQEAAQTPKVEVRGVRIVGDGYGEGMEGIRPFNWSKGTTIVLLVSKPDGGIVEVSEAKATTFVDDKGTNLAAPQTRGGFMMSGGGMSQISDDGKACMAEINADRVPAKGATLISAKGTILLKCGSKKETVEQKNVALKQGTAITAGPFNLKITKTGEPEMMFGWGGDDENKDAWQVTLQAKQDLSNVAEINFLDAAGKEIEVSDGGTSSMSFGNSVTVDKSFILPKQMDPATIAITYWADLKEVKVPFDLKATVGLE